MNLQPNKMYFIYCRWSKQMNIIELSYAEYKAPNNMPAATQWTVSTDLTNRTIYYHTMYNRTIRRIEMDKIDFANIQFQYHPLDEEKTQTIMNAIID